MINLSFLAGLIAASLHVVSGPDHLAAVTPLAIETKRKVWRVGILWGLGHMMGILVVGTLFLLFREAIPVEKISEQSEQLVGIVLVGVGLWAFYSIFKTRKKALNKKLISPLKDDGDYRHNTIQQNHAHTQKKRSQQNLWPAFGLGILHGLAGVTHIILLLPVLSFNNLPDGIFYVTGFALGTMLSMTIYALTVGRVAKYAEQQENRNVFDAIRFLGGVFAISIGIYWLYISF